MSEFCVRCAEKEARIEIMQTNHFNEMQEIRKELARLQEEVEKLSFDVAFYNGSITNLSCNNK